MNKHKFVIFSILGSFGLITMFSCNGIRSEKITLKGDDAIELGETAELNAEILPKETSDKKVNWSSSDSSVAFVDSDGKVTGIKPGKVTITATSNSNGSVKQSIEMNIGNYISTHVTSLSLTAKETTIEEGKYSYITANVYPTNADNKKVTWKSSDAEKVSVDEYGIIKGEYPTDDGKPVQITATTKDGNIQESISITVKATSEARKLNGFREPSCILNYKLKTSEAEKKINEQGINRKNSSSYINGNFYKNDDSSLDTYVVGNKNPFKIRCKAFWGSKDWEDFTEDNPWQTVTIALKDGGEASSYFKPLEGKQNKIEFNDSAKDKIFTITIKPDNTHYTYDSSNPVFTKTFNVKVIDGYNAYNFADLTTIDNWSTTQGKKILGETSAIFTNNEFVDCWAEYKRANGIDPVTNYANVILQNNITVKNEDLPDYIKWTEHETNDYINGVKDPETKQRFNDYVEIKSNVHQDDWKSLPVEAKRAKCRYLLNGSQKDSTAIFNRYIRLDKGDPDFALEGNYFTIDTSNVKPVAMFEQTTLDQYGKNATNLACFINFGGFGDYHHKYHICSKQESIKEEVFDNFRPYTASCVDANSLCEIKNVQIHGNSTRDVYHDEGMGGVNLTTTTANCKFTNLLCHECSNAFYGLTSNTNCPINIERCKVFDMFSSFIRSYNQGVINVKDSFFKDSGGVGVTLTEPVSESSHTGTEMNIENTYMEAFVSGDEVYNKNNMGHVIIKILAAIGLGAWEQYKDLSFNGNPCDHHSIVEVGEDGIPRINFLIFHNYSPFLQSTEAGKTVVTNKKSTGDEKLINLDEGTIIDTYNNMDTTARTLLSMPFQSSAGGHGRIPFWEIAEANDLELFDEHISKEISEHQTYKLSYYKEHQTEINASCPSYAQNAAKLFSGDYLTTYMSALGNYMSAFVLGYK